MMRSLDILYYSLAVGFIVLVLFMSYASYQLAKTMMSFRRVIDEVEDVTTDISRFKNIVKFGVFSAITNVMKNFTERRR